MKILETSDKGITILNVWLYNCVNAFCNAPSCDMKMQNITKYENENERNMT